MRPSARISETQSAQISGSFFSIDASLIVTSLFTHPGFGYCSALGDVVYDEDELVIVVAVKDLDVDARLGHPSRDLAELTWFSLVQSQDDDVAYFQNVNARRFERFASGLSILEEKVSALTVDYEGATTFDAHPGAAQRLAHLGQRAGSISQRNRQIYERRSHAIWNRFGPR